MTRRNLIQKLVQLYTNAIEAVKVAPDPMSACYAYGVQQGVCTAMARHCASSSSEMRDNYLIMSDDFKKYADHNSNWWGRTPQDVALTALPFVEIEREEILETLEYRLSILKELYEST